MRNPNKTEMAAINELLSIEEEASSTLDLLMKRLRREHKVSPKCEMCEDGHWRNKREKNSDDEPKVEGEALSPKEQAVMDDHIEKAEFAVTERRQAMAALRKKCGMPFTVKLDPYRGKWMDIATQQLAIEPEKKAANGNGGKPGKRRGRKPGSKNKKKGNGATKTSPSLEAVPAPPVAEVPPIDPPAPPAPPAEPTTTQN